MTKHQRSYCMSCVKGKNTKPEILFRKYLWNNNARGYRIHKNLPGKPDIYFSKSKIAIFIDGCFWHGCSICKKMPKTNKKFWRNKFRKNIQRDLENDVKLDALDIKVIRFWEHEIVNNIKKCYSKLNKQL